MAEEDGGELTLCLCHSFIPYCSSDVWSGASSKSEKSESPAFLSLFPAPERQGREAGLGLGTPSNPLTVCPRMPAPNTHGWLSMAGWVPARVHTPGCSLGRGPRHSFGPLTTSLQSAQATAPGRASRPPARPLPPSNLEAGSLALCLGPHLKPPSLPLQMSTPSWVPSSSRRWSESSWAKG